MARLGWIGFGEIGAPMAQRLIAAGHDVIVWNRNPERLRAALDAGAIAAESPRALAEQCEATFVCITDGAAVETVVFGDDGIARGARAGHCIVDHSTIHPQEARTFGERLAPQSIAWIDAPVSGGPAGARSGTLASFLGGSDADVARVQPWIAAYVAKATHIGPVGSGQLAKSCNQAVVASTIAIWAEVIAYARANGIDPALVVDAVEGGWADSPVRRTFGPPMAARETRSDRRTLILKDLEIASDVAASVHAPMPVMSTVTTLFRMALARAPHGGMAAVAKLYED